MPAGVQIGGYVIDSSRIGRAVDWDDYSGTPARMSHLLGLPRPKPGRRSVTDDRHRSVAGLLVDTPRLGRGFEHQLGDGLVCQEAQWIPSGFPSASISSATACFQVHQRDAVFVGHW